MAKKKSFSISNALMQGLEQTVMAAQNYSGELRIEVIPLKKLETDPDNPRDLALNFDDLHLGLAKDDKHYQRKIQEKDTLQTIAHSIKTQGIINPIVVYKHGEKYRLIAGERRALASIIAGKEDIQANVVEKKPEPLKLSLLQWIENIEREDLTLWERLRNLEKIIAAYAQENKKPPTEITPTDLSRLLGCSLPLAMNYVVVLNASAALKTLIQENSIKNLEKAAAIAKAPLIMQSQMMNSCLAGATLKQLKAIITDFEKKTAAATIKQSDSRGRKSSQINLGSTRNTKLAKSMFNALLEHQHAHTLKHEFAALNWEDYKAVTHAFRKLINHLEKTPH